MRSGCEFFLKQCCGRCAAPVDARHHPLVTQYLYCASTSGTQPCRTNPGGQVATPQLRGAVLTLSDVGHAVGDLHHDAIQGLGQADLTTQTGPEHEKKQDQRVFGESIEGDFFLITSLRYKETHCCQTR